MIDTFILEAMARSIVNQLFDVAEVPVEIRQAVNDQCDSYVMNVLWNLVDALTA